MENVFLFLRGSFFSGVHLFQSILSWLQKSPCQPDPLSGPITDCRDDFNQTAGLDALCNARIHLLRQIKHVLNLSVCPRHAVTHQIKDSGFQIGAFLLRAMKGSHRIGMDCRRAHVHLPLGKALCCFSVKGTPTTAGTFCSAQGLEPRWPAPSLELFGSEPAPECGTSFCGSRWLEISAFIIRPPRLNLKHSGGINRPKSPTR